MYLRGGQRHSGRAGLGGHVSPPPLFLDRKASLRAGREESRQPPIPPPCIFLLTLSPPHPPSSRLGAGVAAGADEHGEEEGEDEVLLDELLVVRQHLRARGGAAREGGRGSGDERPERRTVKEVKEKSTNGQREIDC